jgi:hypothetical protein
MGPTFEILIAQEHKAILDRIRAFFGVGQVIINGKNAVFRVQVLSELVNVIIPHFHCFPLLTTKVITFTVWAQAVALFSAGAHKTEEGFMQIVSIYAAIGRGVSKTVAVHFPFPNLQPVSLPKYELTTTVEQLESSWISGYLTVYCTFQAYIEVAGWKNDYYHKFKHIFSFSRDITELQILQLIGASIGGNVYIREDGRRADVNVASRESAQQVIDLFKAYPLQSRKHQEFLIWKQFVESSAQWSYTKQS